MRWLLTLNNSLLMWLLLFFNRLRPVGQVMSYQVFTEAKSRGLNVNSDGSVHPVQGSAQWNSSSQSHIKGLPQTSMGLALCWEIHRRNHSSGAAHMKEGSTDIENRLLFTLPYLLFILLQNFTQPIANLHSWVEHKGTKHQKIKSFLIQKA